MFFVSTCKVALPTQEEQRTNLITDTTEYEILDSTHTQTNKNNQYVSVRDVRFDGRGLPGTTPFGA